MKQFGRFELIDRVTTVKLPSIKERFSCTGPHLLLKQANLWKPRITDYDFY